MFVSRASALSFLSLFFLIPALAGCETVDGWVNGSAKDGVLVKNGAPSSIMSGKRISADTYTPRGTPLSDDDLRRVTNQTSGGSVEVYDIDDAKTSGMISIAPVSSVQLPVGMAYPSDPSVTVYPLDDFGASYGGYGSSLYAPATPYMPGSISRTPLDHGGKPSPRAGKDVSSVYFEYGSDRIGSNDASVLKEAANIAKFAPVERVRVEGHASPDAQTKDPIRARLLNLEESMKRAYAVSRRLIEQGVPAEKIKTVAWGDTVPAGGNEAQRRVDIIATPGS